MDTPPPASPSQSSLGSSSRYRSGLDEMLARLPGTCVQLYALYLFSPSLSLPSSDPRWIRVLFAMLGIVSPALVLSLYSGVRRSLERINRP